MALVPGERVPEALVYFLSHDDDVTRALEALAGGPDPDLLADLDLIAHDLAEEMELYAEVYTPSA